MTTPSSFDAQKISFRENLENPPVQPEKKAKKSLTRTASGFFDKKINQNPPVIEGEQPWEKAKKRWPNSTQGIHNDTDYYKFRKEYSQEIFPTLIKSGKPLEKILDDIEYRHASGKVCSAWATSNSGKSLEEFASQNSGWLAYCEMAKTQTGMRAYRNSDAWKKYDETKS